jgi:molybdenum cofactor biosynthesis enzyme MoaA
MNYYELEPEDNHFSDVVIDITHKCNMSCKNCYIPNRDIPDMDINKMIDAISRFPKRTMIRIIGAEPTMRRDLPEIITRIKQTRNRCTLLTNGLRLSVDDYVKKLKSAGLRHCYISLNGADNDDWYEQIDELRCANKKIKALENLVNNKFIIDTGTIIVKGVNDEVIERMLHVYKKTGVENVMCRIKNIGDIGRSMADGGNYTQAELITLLSQQTGMSEDYIYSWKNKPIYENDHVEADSFMIPLDPKAEGKFVHKSGIWFKIANWNSEDSENVPLSNSLRRGRLTEDFKVAPFFEHVKLNEFEY